MRIFAAIRGTLEKFESFVILFIFPALRYHEIRECSDPKGALLADPPKLKSGNVTCSYQISTMNGGQEEDERRTRTELVGAYNLILFGRQDLDPDLRYVLISAIELIERASSRSIAGMSFLCGCRLTRRLDALRGRSLMKTKHWVVNMRL